MRIPKRLATPPLFGHWTVVLTENLPSDLCGLCDYESREILLLPPGPQMSTVCAIETWWHELFHACFHAAGLSRVLGLGKEEQVVEILSKTVILALKQAGYLNEEGVESNEVLAEW